MKKISKACDDYIKIGIQGGIGSFNEEALISNVKFKNYEIKYLYTTEKVLEELESGKIDLGQFAIFNKYGGIVDENINAISKYNFNIIDKYIIKIEQCLLAKNNIDISEIKTIMSHPQGFAQCKGTLEKKYPNLKQIVGRGKLIDPAYLASKLSTGKLSTNISIIGNKTLAKIYHLKIVERNLQDSKENYTSFLLVSKFC